VSAANPEPQTMRGHLQAIRDHRLVSPDEEALDNDLGWIAYCECGWDSGPHGSTPAAMYAAYAVHVQQVSEEHAVAALAQLSQIEEHAKAIRRIVDDKHNVSAGAFHSICHNVDAIRSTLGDPDPGRPAAEQTGTPTQRSTP
jgi:hypothetical protein